MGAVSVQPIDGVLAHARAPLTPDDRRRLGDDATELRDTYGPRWIHVPTGWSARAASARTHLGGGVVPIDIDRSDPVRVTQELGAFVTMTSALTEQMLAGCAELNEALHVDLDTLPLRDLRRVCDALIRLSDAPPFPPSWAAAPAAHAAAVVLATLGDDLRALADIRRSLYEEFTEDVWTLPDRRFRARARLAHVTRSGKAPARARRTLAMLRRGRELNTKVEAAWSAVSGHLGHFATQGIPDVDGAIAALAAVLDLHTALGQRLDTPALRALAAADAFVADEMLEPARSTSGAIDAWCVKANRFAQVDPTPHSASQLRSWGLEITDALEVLASLKSATAPLRATVRTAGLILQDAIRRDRVDGEIALEPTTARYS